VDNNMKENKMNDKTIVTVYVLLFAVIVCVANG